MAYKIALYPGDGIGPEVVAEARKVLDAAGADCAYTLIDWNTTLYKKTGACAPDDYLDQLKNHDAILLGALGNAANAPDHVAVQPLLGMRRGFDQYVNIRPAVLYEGVDAR